MHMANTNEQVPSHRSGMLMASSTVHGRLTWPEMLNSLVPLLLGRPMLEYHCKWVGWTDAKEGVGDSRQGTG